MANKQVAQNIFQSISCILDKKIEGLNYDETKEGIVKGSITSEGYYPVEINGITYEVIPREGDVYTQGETIYVLFPAGDTSRIKVSLGKKVLNFGIGMEDDYGLSKITPAISPTRETGIDDKNLRYFNQTDIDSILLQCQVQTTEPIKVETNFGLEGTISFNVKVKSQDGIENSEDRKSNFSFIKNEMSGTVNNLINFTDQHKIIKLRDLGIEKAEQITKIAFQIKNDSEEANQIIIQNAQLIGCRDDSQGRKKFVAIERLDDNLSAQVYTKNTNESIVAVSTDYIYTWQFEDIFGINYRNLLSNNNSLAVAINDLPKEKNGFRVKAQIASISVLVYPSQKVTDPDEEINNDTIVLLKDKKPNKKLKYFGPFNINLIYAELNAKTVNIVINKDTNGTVKSIYKSPQGVEFAFTDTDINYGEELISNVIYLFNENKYTASIQYLNTGENEISPKFQCIVDSNDTDIIYQWYDAMGNQVGVLNTNTIEKSLFSGKDSRIIYCIIIFSNGYSIQTSIVPNNEWDSYDDIIQYSYLNKKVLINIQDEAFEGWSDNEDIFATDTAKGKYWYSRVKRTYRNLSREQIYLNYQYLSINSEEKVLYYSYFNDPAAEWVTDILQPTNTNQIVYIGYKLIINGSSSGIQDIKEYNTYQAMIYCTIEKYAYCITESSTSKPSIPTQNYNELEAPWQVEQPSQNVWFWISKQLIQIKKDEENKKPEEWTDPQYGTWSEPYLGNEKANLITEFNLLTNNGNNKGDYYAVTVYLYSNNTAFFTIDSSNEEIPKKYIVTGITDTDIRDNCLYINILGERVESNHEEGILVSGELLPNLRYYINADMIQTGVLQVISENGAPLIRAGFNDKDVQIAGFNVGTNALESGNNKSEEYVKLGTDEIKLGQKFSVTNKGSLQAQEGVIGSLTLSNGALHSPNKISYKEGAGIWLDKDHFKFQDKDSAYFTEMTSTGFYGADVNATRFIGVKSGWAFNKQEKKDDNNESIISHILQGPNIHLKQGTFSLLFNEDGIEFSSMNTELSKFVFWDYIYKLPELYDKVGLTL